MMYAMKNTTFRICRLLIAACLTLCALPTMAQYYGDDDEYGPEEYISFLEIEKAEKFANKKHLTNIRIGSCLTGVSNADYPGLGYDASVAFLFSKSYYYFMPEVGLGMRYCDTVDLEDFDHHPSVGKFRDVRFDAIGHNLKVRPLQFGVLGRLANGLVDLHVGSFASYDYVQKTRLTEDSMFDPEYDTLPEQNRLDYGVNVGFGLYAGRFNMDFTYEHGFANFFESRSSKSYTMIFRLGCIF